MKIGFVGRLILGSCLFSLLVVAGVEIALAQAEEKLGPNLIENGDFEAESSEDTWGLDIPDRQQMMNEGTHGGKHCLKLLGGGKRDYKKEIPVKEGTYYLIRFWAKVEGSGGMNIKCLADGKWRNIDEEYGVRTVSVNDQKDWGEAQILYWAAKGVTAIKLSPRVSGKGVALFDDLSIHEAKPKPRELIMETVGTIHAGGVQVSHAPDNAAAADLHFRKKGEKEWKEALPPALIFVNDVGYESGTMLANIDDVGPRHRHFIGSIFYLEPSTPYEVKVTLKDDKGKEIKSLNGEFKTLADEVVYGKGKTLKVGEGGEYKTINEALKAAKAGDTVLVGPGMYKEAVQVSSSGEPGNPLTLRGEKGVMLDGENPKAGYGVHIAGQHDIVVENFEIRGFNYAFLVDKGERIVIQRNRIQMDSGSHYGFRLKNVKELLIQRNTLTTSGDVRAHLDTDGASRMIIRYNKFTGPSKEGIVLDTCKDNLDVYENSFPFPARLSGWDRGACINLRYWNNIHTGSGPMPILVVPIGPIYVLRNVFQGPMAIGTRDGGVSFLIERGRPLNCFGPAFFYHNTFFDPDKTLQVIGQPPENLAKLPWPNKDEGLLDNENFILANNIFYGGVLNKITHRKAGDLADSGQIKSDYNNFWADGRKDRWKEEDAHSVYEEPLFMNPAQKDFRLKEGSPGIDKAMRLPNINDNFAGKGPDMGALEVGGDNWVEKAMERSAP